MPKFKYKLDNTQIIQYFNSNNIETYELYWFWYLSLIPRLIIKATALFTKVVFRYKVFQSRNCSMIVKWAYDFFFTFSKRKQSKFSQGQWLGVVIILATEL